jgi:hypothetical protein
LSKLQTNEDENASLKLGRGEAEDDGDEDARQTDVEDGGRRRSSGGAQQGLEGEVHATRLDTVDQREAARCSKNNRSATGEHRERAGVFGLAAVWLEKDRRLLVEHAGVAPALDTLRSRTTVWQTGTQARRRRCSRRLTTTRKKLLAAGGVSPGRIRLLVSP